MLNSKNKYVLVRKNYVLDGGIYDSQNKQLIYPFDNMSIVKATNESEKGAKNLPTEPRVEELISQKVISDTFKSGQKVSETNIDVLKDKKTLLTLEQINSMVNLDAEFKTGQKVRETDIDKGDDSLTTLANVKKNIAPLAKEASTNADNIKANTKTIIVNTGDIKTNVTNIGNNVTNITKNINDISALNNKTSRNYKIALTHQLEIYELYGINSNEQDVLFGSNTNIKPFNPKVGQALQTSFNFKDPKKWDNVKNGDVIFWMDYAPYDTEEHYFGVPFYKPTLGKPLPKDVKWSKQFLLNNEYVHMTAWRNSVGIMVQLEYVTSTKDLPLNKWTLSEVRTVAGGEAFKTGEIVRDTSIDTNDPNSLLTLGKVDSIIIPVEDNVEILKDNVITIFDYITKEIQGSFANAVGIAPFNPKVGGAIEISWNPADQTVLKTLKDIMITAKYKTAVDTIEEYYHPYYKVSNGKPTPTTVQWGLDFSLMEKQVHLTAWRLGTQIIFHLEHTVSKEGIGTFDYEILQVKISKI